MEWTCKMARRSREVKKSTKQKDINRKTKATEVKEKRILAWIGAGATVTTALVAGFFSLINNLTNEKSSQTNKPVPTPLHRVVSDKNSWSMLNEPIVVWPKHEDSKYGYTAPPKLQIECECSDSLEQDVLWIQCDKSRVIKGSSMEEVESKHIAIVPKAGDRRLVATFDVNSFIVSSPAYSGTPHGYYRGFVKMITQQKPEGHKKDFIFNYVYQENFSRLSDVLSTSDEEFVSIPEFDGGLEMKVLEGKRRVSSNLIQKFDFKTNFCILGIFTVEFEKTNDPSSLDISVCDKWGEKLAVIFADGNLNTFSIKLKDEKRGEHDVTLERARTGVGRTMKGENIFNYFEIHVEQFGYRKKCSLFLRHNGPIQRGDSPVHSRWVDDLEFLTKFTRINIKLRKPGRVKLYDFEVAQLLNSKNGL